VTQTIAAREAIALPLPWEEGESPRPRFALRAQYAPALSDLSAKLPCRLRARNVRDAAQTIAAPDKLAKILGRPRQLADSWLPVPIPDDLALAYGGGVSLDAGRALLRGRLAKLCAWLNARLDEPPRVVELGPCRQITVFGPDDASTHRYLRGAKLVDAKLIDRDGNADDVNDGVDIGKFVEADARRLRRAVNSGLGLSDIREYFFGRLLYAFVKRAFIYEGGYLFYGMMFVLLLPGNDAIELCPGKGLPLHLRGLQLVTFNFKFR